MNGIESFILGLAQGLTEFIPVSSSGHLVIVQTLLSGESSHLFLEFINIGTLLALIVYFWKRIAGIIHEVVVNKNLVLARNVLITSMPAGIIGFMLATFIENSSFFGNSLVVAATLGLVGTIMIVLERLPKASARVDGEHLSPWRALIVGIAQVFALIPGVSRSGSTIIAGRLVGLGPKAAAEYSFLASLPIMFGVTLKVLLSSDDREYMINNLSMLLIGNAIAFISGLVAIGFLLRYLANHNLALFGWYRVGLAAVVVSVILLQ